MKFAGLDALTDLDRLRIKAFARFVTLYTGRRAKFACRADAYLWASRVVNGDGRADTNNVSHRVHIGALSAESRRRLIQACESLWQA